MRCPHLVSCACNVSLKECCLSSQELVSFHACHVIQKSCYGAVVEVVVVVHVVVVVVVAALEAF